MGRLADELQALVSVDDPIANIERLREGGSGFDDCVVGVHFATAVPTGWLAEELVVLDRAFRLAARFAESGESIEGFLGHRRRGIPVADGLVADAFAKGSVRVRLRPSPRIREHLKTFGLAELALVIGILNGTVDLASKLEDERPPNDEPDVVYVFDQRSQITHEIHLHLVRGDDSSDLVLRPAEDVPYRVLPPGSPPEQLEP